MSEDGGDEKEREVTFPCVNLCEKNYPKLAKID